MATIGAVELNWVVCSAHDISTSQSVFSRKWSSQNYCYEYDTRKIYSFLFRNTRKLSFLLRNTEFLIDALKATVGSLEPASPPRNSKLHGSKNETTEFRGF